VVSGNVASFVRKIRTIIGGTLVQFKFGDMMRIAFSDGRTFDFSAFQGTIEEDLSRRDFTMNAIAWSPGRGMIDLYRGADDIGKSRVRAISKGNLIDDPLRMLRAYRFAAELNGSIDSETRRMIKILRNRIKDTASERITLEFFHLLNSVNSGKYLKTALSDGLLSKIFLFPFRELELTIREISKLERMILHVFPETFKVLLNKIFSQNLTFKGLLCLEILTRNHFPLPDSIHSLTISGKILKRIVLAAQGIKSVDNIRTPGELFEFFFRSGEAMPDILIIKKRLDLLGEYMRFKKILKGGFLTSEEIIDIAGIESGPAIGNIILLMKKAQFERRVRTKVQAIKLLKNIILLNKYG
jgi:tRNA nucleotidyltransferase (CCA-adding enzyme)